MDGKSFARGFSGVRQPLPISYTGFAYGAGVAWCFQTNESLDMPAVLSTFAFDDKTDVMGKLAFDLGNVYHIIGPDHINGQTLAYSLQMSRDDMAQRMAMYEAWGGQAMDLRPETIRHAISRIDEITSRLENTDMQRPDAELISSEFLQAADLLRHAARRLLMLNGDANESPAALASELQDLIARQRSIWLARNRPGGLEDSLNRFDTLLNDYKG